MTTDHAEAASGASVSEKIRPWLRRLVAVLFASAATFHAIALTQPNIAEPSPPWRHALFIGLNAVYAALFWRGPRWLPFAYAPLALQQLYSHGTELLASWSWQSGAALASIPLFAWIAVRQRSTANGSSGTSS